MYLIYICTEMILTHQPTTLIQVHRRSLYPHSQATPRFYLAAGEKFSLQLRDKIWKQGRTVASSNGICVVLHPTLVIGLQPDLLTCSIASSLLAALEISPITSENWSRPMSIILSRVNSLPGRREGGREGGRECCFNDTQCIRIAASNPLLQTALLITVFR